MVNIKELKPIPNMPEKVSTPGRIELSAFHSALETHLTQYGVPFEIYSDTVKSGSIFNSQEEPAIFIKNPEHPTDYFHYAIRIQYVGNMSFILLNYLGESTLTYKKNVEEERRQSSSLFQNALGAIFSTDDTAYNAEYNYYNILQMCIKQILNI